MIEISRQEFKSDEVYRELWKQIKKIHKVAPHTEAVLIKNRHIKDFCEEARHYLVIGVAEPIYLHYDVSSWYKNGGAVVKIDSIGVYDNKDEYEKSRLHGLHSTIHSDGANLN